MNTTTDHIHNGPGGRDVLLSRIIDGRADAMEWGEFRQLATSDAGVWDELRTMQSDHDTLVHAVSAALAGADSIDLPEPDYAPKHTPAHTLAHAEASGHDPADRQFGWGRWLGWGVAASIALAWFGANGPLLQGPGASGDTHTAGLVNNPLGHQQHNPLGQQQNSPLGPTTGSTPNTALAQGMGDMVLISHPQQALDTYLTRGRDAGLVLGELNDRPMLRTAQLPDGRLEVLWVRQIVERSVLPAAFRTGTDDQGNPVAVPVRLEQIALPNAPVH